MPDYDRSNTEALQGGMLCLNTKYAITINPDDCHQFGIISSSLTQKPSFSKEMRLHYAYRYISNKFVWKYKDLGISFVLYPEITLPDRNKTKSIILRIHFHGTIEFTNIQGLNIWYMYLYTEMSQIASVFIKAIKDDEWKKYIKKNSKVMKELCKYHKVDYILKTSSVKYVT